MSSAASIPRTGPVPSRFMVGIFLATLFLAAACNPIQIAIANADIDRDQLGIETVAKLGVAAIAMVLGFWAVLQSVAVRSMFVRLPGFLLGLLAFALLITSAFAFPEAAKISRAAAVIFVGYVMFIAAAVSVVDLRRAIMAMVLGSGVFLVTTWIVFLVFPSLGRFEEFSDEFNSVIRMGGTAHPNGVAREALMAILMSGWFLRSGTERESRPMIRLLLWSIVVIAVATLLMTFSRTVMLAGAVAIVAMMWDRLWTRAGMQFALAGLAMVVAGFLGSVLMSNQSLDTQGVAAAVTKSGDFSELTTLTGRTEIWAEAWSLACQRPITGWGLDSAASIMSEHSMGTHNLVLHVLFSGGLFSVTALLALLVLTAWIGLTTRVTLFRGVMAYIFMSALVEDTLIESFPSGLTMLWLMLLLYPAAMWARSAKLASSTCSFNVSKSYT